MTGQRSEAKMIIDESHQNLDEWSTKFKKGEFGNDQTLNSGENICTKVWRKQFHMNFQYQTASQYLHFISCQEKKKKPLWKIVNKDEKWVHNNNQKHNLQD